MLHNIRIVQVDLDAMAAIFDISTLIFVMNVFPSLNITNDICKQLRLPYEGNASPNMQIVHRSLWDLCELDLIYFCDFFSRNVLSVYVFFTRFMSFLVQYDTQIFSKICGLFINDNTLKAFVISIYYYERSIGRDIANPSCSVKYI